MEISTGNKRSKLRDYFLVLSGLVSAILIVSVPLQLYIPLGRHQHYGLSVFSLGLGYVLQTVWSWRHLKGWSRLGYLATGCYLSSIGVVLYANPWLDSKVGIMTGEKKALIGWIFIILGFVLVFIYIRWMKELHHEKEAWNH